MTIARNLQEAATAAAAMPWTPASLAAARSELGLTAADLGRLLRLDGRDPGRMVKAWESGAARIPGPVTLALEFILAAKRRKQAPLPRLTEPPGQPPAARPTSPTGQPANTGQERAPAPVWLDLRLDDKAGPLLADERHPDWRQPAKRRRRDPA